MRVKKQHIKDKETINRCKELAKLSRDLFNRANYIVRQAYTNHHDNIPEYTDLIQNNRTISGFALAKRMRKLDEKAFRDFPNSRTAGNIIKTLDKSWKSRLALIKKYKDNHEKKVGIVNFSKDESKVYIYIDKQSIRIVDGYCFFPDSFGLKPIKYIIDEGCKLKEIRIAYNNGEYYFYHVYQEKQCEPIEVYYNKFISIDIGINNIMTVVDNEGESFIVNGRPIKSINQFFNKQMAKAHSYVGDKGTSNRIKALCHKRNNRFNNILHEMSNEIIKYCIKHKIGNIIIGKNKEWKQRCKLHKKIKQHFVQIPHARLIDLIKYKAEQNNIKVVEQMESHTSKCDALAKEEVKHHDKYLGRRVERGLFKSSTGIKINADVNGALNIMRRVVGDDFIDNLNMDKVIAPYRI